MDFDVSTPSVTEALGDLRRKAQSLQEDGELYAGLETKARAGFERHRADLTQLLQKERAIHAASEERLRAELQRLLADAETLRAEIAEANTERERRAIATSAKSVSTRSVSHSAASADSSAVVELREALAAARADVAHAVQERAWHSLQLRELLQRQRDLHDTLRRQSDTCAPCAVAESADMCEGVRGSPTRRVDRLFIPTGPAEATAPATQHIAAIVSTVERRNRLVPRLFNRRNGIPSPMERRAADSPLRGGRCAAESQSPQRPLVPPSETESARHLAAVCRSLLREVCQLRREYQQCTAELASPHADSIEVSRRMRVAMGELDRKIHQLRSLRQQQAMVEEKLKLHDMMLEIAAENNYCESVYSDLLELIRT